MAQFNLGNVLAQAEQIKALRSANDPNSVQNQLAQTQLQSAQTVAEEQQRTANTRRLYEGYVRMANDPNSIPGVVQELQASGLIAPGWRANKPLDQLSADAAKQAQVLGQILGIKGREGVTLSQGQTHFGPNGEVIASVPARPDTLSPEAEAQKARIAAAGRSQNVVNVAGDKAEAVEIAKANVKWWEGVTDRADSAESLLNNVNQMDTIDVETGALEPAKVAIAAVAEGFGVDASALANVTNAQAFTAVSNRIVNDVLNQAKGPQTEGDAQRAKSTIASLGNTPKARKFITASLKATALRAIEMRDFLDARIEQGESLSKARAEWRKFRNEVPSLSDTVKTDDGLPVFFFQFKEHAKLVRPGITDEEIIAKWKERHGR